MISGYLIAVGLIGLAFLAYQKLSAIATSLANMDRCTQHLSNQVGVLNERIHELSVSVDYCKSDVEAIKRLAESVEVRIPSPPTRPTW